MSTFNLYFQSAVKVKWAPDNLDGYLNFYSVSGDGRVTHWSLVKTSLWASDIQEITLSAELHNNGEQPASQSRLLGESLEVRSR